MMGLNVKELIFQKTEDFQLGAKYSSPLEGTPQKAKALSDSFMQRSWQTHFQVTSKFVSLRKVETKLELLKKDLHLYGRILTQNS
jgi:hypothetical protein